MAYRKKTRAKTPARRRVGAVRSRGQNITKLLGAVAGSIAPQMLKGIKIGDTVLDAKIIGAGSAVVGFLLPRFIKGDLGEGLGVGMIVGGSTMLLREFNVISGIPIISGWEDMKTINGVSDSASTATKVNEAVQNQEYRPTFSQVMNGIYNRGYRD